MFVARGMVEVHVSHIFARLGLSNRADLATLATRRSAGGDRWIPRTTYYTALERAPESENRLERRWTRR